MTTSGFAAIVRELDGTFHVEPVEFGDPIGREVRVEVRAAGLCHSDLNVARVERGRARPLVAGHELAGVVVATGPDARLLKAGDHVVGTEIRSCGDCVRCRTGRASACLDPNALERPDDAAPRIITATGEPIRTLGVSAFASYSIADERQFVRIPDAMPFAPASLLGCGVTTGMGAVHNVAKVSPGESVAVFGLGGVGLNIVAGAASSGASRIVAIDIDAEKLELARTFGATDTIDSSVHPVPEALFDVAALGVDHAFDAVGVHGIAMTALRTLANGGCAYLIGIPAPGDLLEVDTMRDMLADQRGIRGVYMGGSVPTRDLPIYADSYLRGRLRLDELISDQVALGDINEAYATPPAKGARAVITSFTSTGSSEHH